MIRLALLEQASASLLDDPSKHTCFDSQWKATAWAPPLPLHAAPAHNTDRQSCRDYKKEVEQFFAALSAADQQYKFTTAATCLPPLPLLPPLPPVAPRVLSLNAHSSPCKHTWPSISSARAHLNAVCPIDYFLHDFPVDSEKAAVVLPAISDATPPRGSTRIGISNAGVRIWLSSAASASLPQFKSVYFASMEQQYAGIRAGSFSREALTELDFSSVRDLGDVDDLDPTPDHPSENSQNKRRRVS